MSIKSKMLAALTLGLFGQNKDGDTHLNVLSQPTPEELKKDVPSAVKKKRFVKRAAKKKRARVSRRKNRK